MTLSVGGVSQSCQAYQIQERIAERSQEQAFQKAVDQGDRVTLSAEARALAEPKPPVTPPPGFHGPIAP